MNPNRRATARRADQPTNRARRAARQRRREVSPNGRATRYGLTIAGALALAAASPA